MITGTKAGCIIIDDPYEEQNDREKLMGYDKILAWKERMKPRRQPYTGAGHRGIGRTPHRKSMQCHPVVYGMDFARTEKRQTGFQNIPRIAFIDPVHSRENRFARAVSIAIDLQFDTKEVRSGLIAFAKQLQDAQPHVREFATSLRAISDRYYERLRNIPEIKPNKKFHGRIKTTGARKGQRKGRY